MPFNFKKFFDGLNVFPKTSSTSDSQGDLEVLTSDGKLRYHNGSVNSPLVTEVGTNTLTNKTIDADLNTITNIENADIKAGAAIDAAKIANGSVSNAEFQQLDGLTSAAVGISDTQTLSNKSLVDNSTFIVDNVDPTKRIAFEATNITTGNTRTLFMPDSSLVVVGTATTQTLTNKTISASNNTITDITNTSIDAAAAIARTKLASGNAYRIIANDASGVMSENAAITASRAVASDANGQLVASATTSAELAFVSGVTSSIQTQINGKQASGNYITDLTGDITATGPGSAAATLATVNSNVGTFGSSVLTPVITVNGKGLVTAVTTATSATSSSRAINAQTGTTYSFVLTDGSNNGNNPLVTASNASPQTYTVPLNSSIAFPVGSQIDVIQQGAGKVTFAPAGGVTINSQAGNLSIAAQYVGVSLIKTATDTWTLIGNLIA